MAAMEEYLRKVKAAMASKAAALDELELKALKAMGAMEEGDATFGSGSEVSLDSRIYRWHDMYGPRKPRYFNRVHTGYVWNKYNRTHYDQDNPPPKVVQGYKFNIFYPNLVDKTKTPSYTIEEDGSSRETCIISFHAGSDRETCMISFHAGPPYEDIAFRIVNADWECSYKEGFKCTFDLESCICISISNEISIQGSISGKSCL